MNRNLVIKRLWWKELQQLWPLVLLLLVVGGGLQALFAAVPTSFDAWRHTLIFVGLPGLFAVGAGALIVGQEKELRTLQWLSSLPISARDILSTKLLVGLVGLVFVWIASWLIAGATGAWPTTVSGNIEVLPFVAHSFFVLTVGFATAWRLKSSFVSLLLLIPLAGLPLLLASVQASAFGRTQQLEYLNLWMMIYSGLFAVAFLWWGWRIGLRQLGPQSGMPWVAQASGQASLAAIPFRRQRTTPFAALVWQFAMQNRVALLGLTAVWLLVALAASVDPTSEQIVFLCALVGLLACSWLGMSVFQSDSHDRRAMFLADRGVAPWKVWVTRQVLPLACVLLGLGVMAVMVPPTFAWMNWVTLIAVAVFACSQFCAQVIRSPIVGAIVAPLFSAGFVYFSGVTLIFLFSSLWLVVLSIALLWLGTLWMTRRWMDGRSGWRGWLSYSGMFSLACLLSMLPFLSLLATKPRISSAERQRLELVQQGSYTISPMEMVDPLPRPSEADVQVGVQAVDSTETGQETGDTPPRPIANDRDAKQLTLFQMSDWIERLEAVQRQFGGNQQGVPHGSIQRGLLPRLVLTRMHLQRGAAASPAGATTDEAERADETNSSDETNSNDETAELLRGYRLTVEVMLETCVRLRQSSKLPDQFSADHMQMGLLAELQVEGRSEYLGPALFKRVRAQLSDQVARDSGRRNAIVASWSQRGNADASNIFGYTPEMSGNPYGRASWELWSRIDVVASHLLQLVDAQPAERPALRQRMIEQFGEFEIFSKQAPYLLTAEGKMQLLYGELPYSRGTASAWYGEWEQQAADLVPSQ